MQGPTNSGRQIDHTANEWRSNAFMCSFPCTVVTIISMHNKYHMIHYLIAGPTINYIFQNISIYNNSIDCSFLNNQSYYCMVCCSTDPSVPADSSVYNISTTRDTKVIVSLQGLPGGQMYYCKAAATNNYSASYTIPVIGNVTMYFSFVTSLLPTSSPTTCKCIVVNTRMYMHVLK